MTDLRQGVSPATHAVLDQALAIATEAPNLLVFQLIDLAQKAAAAAGRASPDMGTGARRLHKAREAAALLLVALDRMDFMGRDISL